jgi:hypothetical protein
MILEKVCFSHPQELTISHMGIVMVSNKKRMIVGNIWKSGSKWYNEIPYKNRYKLS